MTGEIAGPDYNGGIGTANRGLALALRHAGFTVDVLYTRVETGQPFCFRGSFEEQVANFRALGVNLMCIDHKGRWDDWLGKSLRAMETLQARSYDVAFFDDTHGSAYFTALAKRTGSPALAHTQLVIVTHSATQWICELNQTPVTTLSDIRLLEIERRSIELADYVVSPSAYILRKYQSYGWSLPANTTVRPNILPFSAERAIPPSHMAAVDEIVFFGRLERRKGLWLFCAALDRLKYELNGKKVTFLGKFTFEDGESTGFGLLRRSAAWPFTPTLLYNYDREQALAYLKGGNRLAVMPSREDNSPSVILECLVEGIPFIASAGSGGQELISPVDHANCLFDPSVEGLTAVLRNALAKGVLTAQPSFKPQDNAKQTIQWVAKLADEAKAGLAAAASTAATQNQASAAAKWTLVQLAPEGSPPDMISDMAVQSAKQHFGSRVLIFAEDVSPLEKSIERLGLTTPENLILRPLSRFTEEMAAISTDAGMLILCRLDQPLPVGILSRAELALNNSSIAALTVMRGHAIENKSTELPFVCSGPFHWQPESFKTGNAPVVMALAQDSNAGLLILRTEDADVLSRISPIDPQLCRLKDIQLYIHEVLLDLIAEDRSFELLPDCFMPAAEYSTARETYELPRIAMRHLQNSKNMPAGSEAAILSRLSVEIFAGEAGRQSVAELLSDLSSRMGEPIQRLETLWPPPKAFASYAKVASAAGRPDLALLLMGKSFAIGKRLPNQDDLTPAALALDEAHTIDVAAIVAAGRFTGLCIEKPWNLRVDAQKQELELHPNSSHEGVATIMLSGLEFQAGTMFVAELEVQATAKGPIRFEIELQASSGEQVGQSWVLAAGERKRAEFILPSGFTGRCDAIFMTRMVRRNDSTEGAHAKWHGPAFRPR